MDNELIIKVGDKELRFKLKSQTIVLLEKLYGKNIFEIFQELSFTTVQRIFWEALQNKDAVENIDEMMDLVLTQKSLIELANEELQELAVKSGILKAKDLDVANESIEEIKNA